MTDQALQTAVDILGPGGTAVSLATMTLLTFRFTAFVIRSIMWFMHRRDRREAGQPSLPPPELPPSLGIVLMFLAGSALAFAQPAARALSAEAIEGANCSPPCSSGQKCENGTCVSKARKPGQPPVQRKPKPVMVDASRDVPGWEDTSGRDPFPSRRPDQP